MVWYEQVRRFRTKAKSYFIASVLGLWVAYSGAYLFFSGDHLGQFISNAVTKSVRGTFHLGSVRFGYWNGLRALFTNGEIAAEGIDFELLDPDGDPVLKVPHANAHVKFWPLLYSLGKYGLTWRFNLTLDFADGDIDSAWALITPTLTSLRQGNEEVNIVAAMAPRDPTPAPSGSLFTIRTGQVQLHKVEFGLRFPTKRDGTGGWRGGFSDAEASAHLSYTTAKMSDRAPDFHFQVGPLRAPHGELVLGTIHLPLTDLAVEHFGPEQAPENFSFAGRTVSDGAMVWASGELRNLYRTPEIALALRVERGAGLLAKLPPPVGLWLGGDANASVSFSGPFAKVALTGTFAGVSSRVRDLPARAVAASLRLAEGKLHLGGLHGEFASGQATGDLDVDFARSSWRTHLKLSDVNPNEVGLLGRVASRELAGSLRGEVSLSGNFAEGSNRTRIQVAGVTLVRSRVDRLPDRVSLSGAVEITPTAITLQSVRASGDGFSVQSSGTIEPKSEKMEADLILDSFSGSGWIRRLAPPWLGLAALHGVARLHGRLSSPALELDLLVSQLGVFGRYFERLSAKVTVDGDSGNLHLEDINASGLGGSASGRAQIGLFAPHKIDKAVPDPQLGASLTLRDLRLVSLTQWPVIDGKMSATLDVSGTLHHPTGGFHLWIPHASIDGDLWKDGEVDVVLTPEGGTFQRIHIMRIAGGALDSEGGKFDWNGNLNIHLSPHDLSLLAIPGLKENAIPIAGSLSGNLTVDGAITAPHLAGDVSLTNFRFGDVVFGDGIARLTRDVVTDSPFDHVRGSFFGDQVLVEGTVSLSKLTAALHIRFRDLPLERFIPELSHLAEIKARASGEIDLVASARGVETLQGKITKLEFSTARVDEDGKQQQLVYRNTEPVLLGNWNSQKISVHIARAQFVSNLGDRFWIEGVAGTQGSDVQVIGQLQLGLIEQLFPLHAEGDIDVNLRVVGDSDCLRPVGTLTLGKNIRLGRHGIEPQLAIRGGKLIADAKQVKLQELNVELDGAKAIVAGVIEQQCLEHIGSLHANVSGELSPKLLSLLINERVADAGGRVGVDLHFDGNYPDFAVQGHAEFHDAAVELQRIDKQLVLRRGTVDLTGNRITIGCPQSNVLAGCKKLEGTFDDGPIWIQGTADLRPDWLGRGDLLPRRIERIDIGGKELSYDAHAYSLTLSPKLALRRAGDGEPIEVSGDVDLTDGRYTRAFDPIALDKLVFRPRVLEEEEPFWRGIPLLEKMQFNVNLHSTGSLIIKNDLADLRVSVYGLRAFGTLDEPRLGGRVELEEGGTITIPGAQLPFQTETGSINFNSRAAFPDETPSLDLHATGIWQDPSEVSHVLRLDVTDVWNQAKPRFSSAEGWDQSTVISIIFLGMPFDQARRIGQPDANSVGRGDAAAMGAERTLSGMFLNKMLSSALKNALQLQTVQLQVDQSAAFFKACPRISERYLKLCGEGEWSFSSASKLSLYLQLRTFESFSVIGRVDYFTQQLSTLQQETTRLKGEFNFKIH